MYAVDLHTHTRFFHGFGPRPTAFDPVGVRLLSSVAARRGLDGVVLTNHDYAYRADSEGRSLDEAGGSHEGPFADGTGNSDSSGDHFDAGARDERRVAGTGGALTTVPGIEISTTRGHLLVIGPDPPRSTRPGSLTPEEAVDLAHDRGCAAVLPHPFRNSVVRESAAAFDAVELNGKTAKNHDAARALAVDRGLPVVGGSDAHYPFEVGRAFTRVDATELTPRAVVDAIMDGRVEPVVARPDAVQRIMGPAYRLVHWGKGHTTTGHRASDGR